VSRQLPKAKDKEMDANKIARLKERWAHLGKVSYNGFRLSLALGERELILFPTGRAIIRGTKDEAEARSLYARFVGT